MQQKKVYIFAIIFIALIPCYFHPKKEAVLYAADLIVNGTTITLGGTHVYDNINVINGGEIDVIPYNGTDRINTGNLVLKAQNIFVDETSTISAKGSGYSTAKCGNGNGPYNSGGKGGCAVRDSGGGGAHFGKGGRGTKDCFVYGSRTTCEFPQEFEEDCGNSLNTAGTACTDLTNCWNYDALPSVAGEPFWHTIYDIEFGAAGGDKGCRDGDGFGTNPNVAGFGGGRIVLVAVNESGTGLVDIRGTIDANGKRGCGNGNDSAGGGAGGTVVIIGNNINIGANAKITSAGGLGGDTQGLAGSPDCPPPAQQGGTCDDCGGGGGGGLVSILGDSVVISETAYFSVDGAAGGTCPICRGEAGGGAGELQLYGDYHGEVCDGYDNDFDGFVDEGLPDLSCGIPSCIGGIPQMCPPDPACIGPVTDTRPRFLIIFDTSASMLTDLDGTPTFGDGSQQHRGIDSNLDGTEGNDSKLYLAKEALRLIISAYPDIDWALARYHQDSGLNRNCQLAHWIECRGMCCSYDDPRNNQPPQASPSCALDTGSSGFVQVNMLSPAGEQCINYSGSCGQPRKGADILVGFGADTRQYLMWMDNRETSFNTDETQGNYCNWAGGGDCELRGTGPTPLAGSINAVEDFLSHVIACDRAVPCRKYGVILLTDGAESCGGDPVTAASSLFNNLSVPLYVIGFSVLPEEVSQLNAIAMAGSGGTTEAFMVGNETELANTLAAIVSTSYIPEICNGLDDDCDGFIDEDFPELGNICYDSGLGVCQGSGIIGCSPDGNSIECIITNPGELPTPEICNGLDDDCDGRIDEDLVCEEICEPEEEICDGIDNNCNGAIDEEDPALGSPCGISDIPPCRLGNLLCISGRLICVGQKDPGTEICNCTDEDCDTVIDNDAVCPPGMQCIDCACRKACDPGKEFSCPTGYECADSGNGTYCVPTPCLECSPEEICIDYQCINPCEGVECAPNEKCIGGLCYNCYVLGCDEGEICLAGECKRHPCENVNCPENTSCILGNCTPGCREKDCPPGSSCGTGGECVPDPCDDTICENGRVCIDSQCVPDPCIGVVCPTGKTCVNGQCLWNLCNGVECQSDYECKILGDGTPICLNELPNHHPVPSDGGVDETPAGVAATGAGGCATCSINTTADEKTGEKDSCPLIVLLINAFAILFFIRRKNKKEE